MAELTYNVTEAAEALGVSRQTMYELIHKEGFPTLKVGGRRLISRELLAEWVRVQAGGQKEAAPGACGAKSGKGGMDLTGPNSVPNISEKRR
ncbi:MAG: helix-turn-helix domain-containing protein [Oscillospiraceae bacterium]|nr:helix-turn-helix domain-containing protein [Oscillospiraceae bacterium]